MSVVFITENMNKIKTKKVHIIFNHIILLFFKTVYEVKSEDSLLLSSQPHVTTVHILVVVSFFFFPFFFSPFFFPLWS